ncbi:hypothetical protein [Cryobacterium sp. Y11]|uniref:hypothetical protein n=1 Tax=Cryobacterium sp. Y11 TaxID=2045016 RepID=UPI000CE3378E|nr:hypothetical protein [Cryobacterium sp. Y11]
MKSTIIAGIGVGVLVLGLGLTACAAPFGAEKETTLDVQTAKGIAVALEDETALLVPPQNVADPTQRKTAHLLGCVDGGHQWSGRTVVTFAGEVDPQSIVDTIAAAWKLKDGVTVEKNAAATGNDAEVDMTVETGGFYTAAIWNSGTQLYITSFSPCFELEEGQHPSDEY